MQHAWKHFERPGGSHTALDGKKMSMQTTELPKHWKASWVTSRGPTDQVSAQLALHWRLYHGPSCGTVQMQVSQQIFFTHKLEPVTSLLCGCVVVCFFCGLFLLVFVFCVVFAVGSLCFGFCSLET